MGEQVVTGRQRQVPSVHDTGILRAERGDQVAERHPGQPARLLQPALLTIDEAAAVLNVPRTWLRDKVTNRQVPHLRLGRHVRFAQEHLQLIITAGEVRMTTAASATGARHRRRSAKTADEQPDQPGARPPDTA